MLANWKRVLILTLLLAVVGTVAAFADDIYETIKAKKVNITLNGNSLDGTLQANNDLLVPVKKNSEALHVIVEQKGSSVEVYKPNYHMFFFTVVNDRLHNTFGWSEVGKTVNFAIFAQVDNLHKTVQNVKYEVFDPNGKSIYNLIDKVNQSDNFFHVTPTMSMKFEEVGEYTVKAYIQFDERGEYYLVSEKALQVKSN